MGKKRKGRFNDSFLNFLFQVLELCPSLEIYLKKECGGNPVDFDMIDKIYDDENRTVYMISYCKLSNFPPKFFFFCDAIFFNYINYYYEKFSRGFRFAREKGKNQRYATGKLGHTFNDA